MASQPFVDSLLIHSYSLSNPSKQCKKFFKVAYFLQKLKKIKHVALRIVNGDSCKFLLF